MYRHSQLRADVAQDRQLVSVGTSNQLQTQQGPQKFRQEDKFTAEEEVIMIPIEDVSLITFKKDIKKGRQADIKATLVPIYKPSENCCDRCCASILPVCCCCCIKEERVVPVGKENTTIVVDQDPTQNSHINEEPLPLPKTDADCCTNFLDRFRCWCCRKKVLVRLIKRTNTLTEQQAQRVIKVSIVYSKYSNPDSASNARLLKPEEQGAYHKKRFEPDVELEFYLVNNTEFDQKNFEIKQKQAEDLCRTVMHLKAMTGKYPSETELDSIIDQLPRRVFGDSFVEPTLQLSVDHQAQQEIASSRVREIE